MGYMRKSGKQYNSSNTAYTVQGKAIRIRDNIPYGCSSVRRICIKCQIVVIAKLDSNYESKVCKECTKLIKTE